MIDKKGKRAASGSDCKKQNENTVSKNSYFTITRLFIIVKTFGLSQSMTAPSVDPIIFYANNLTLNELAFQHLDYLNEYL